MLTRSSLTIRVALASLCLSSHILSSGCSKKPARPPLTPSNPATATSSEKAPQKQAPQKKELTPEEKTRQLAQKKFDLYERKIKAADFARAEAAMRDLRVIYEMESAYKSFWEYALPSTNRIMLTLMGLCESCNDGKCPVCKGNTKCEACEGSGKCQTCDGDPVRTLPCKACVCRSCGGSGKCNSCRGFRSKSCLGCSGNGTSSAISSKTCGRCGGAGYTSGLRGPSGTARLKCLTCNGSGKIPSRVLRTCQTCGGKGRVPCPECTGKGRCANCRGTGRTTPCSTCDSTARTVHKCPQCEGEGKCVICQGTGHCNTCQGSGKCFECSGGLVRIYDFPIDKAWANIKEGHIFYDSRLRQIVEQDEGSGFKEINYKDLELSVTVKPGQIVFIATEPAFDAAASIMKR